MALKTESGIWGTVLPSIDFPTLIIGLEILERKDWVVSCVAAMNSYCNKFFNTFAYQSEYPDKTWNEVLGKVIWDSVIMFENYNGMRPYKVYILTKGDISENVYGEFKSAC